MKKATAMLCFVAAMLFSGVSAQKYEYKTYDNETRWACASTR